MTSKAWRAGRVAALGALFSLSSCYSMTLVAEEQVVRSESGRELTLRVWRNTPGPLGDESPSLNAVLSLAFYPIDALFSTFVVIGVVFDSDAEIRFGPAGALAGIVVPGVTCLPGLSRRWPLSDRSVLDDAAFEELSRRIEAGDGRAAYRELVPGGKFVPVHSVCVSRATSSTESR